MKVLVAMSGGVDSSVAAAVMLEAGHEVVGVTLKQWENPDGSLPITGCCTVSDAEDARRVADRLGVPYYVLDHVSEFTTQVVDRFGADYLAGRTPNPCVECNRRVRFGALFARLDDLGCDALATGHHARVVGPRGERRLRRGVDGLKDQSYVLHMLRSDHLDRVELPIGDMTKDQVRVEAGRLGLRNAAKPDSQDLCFVAGDYRDLLRERFPEVDRPGVIVDLDGTELGRHRGTARFTVGQRKGLGIAVGEPRFVISIDASSGTVVVGPRESLLADGCVLDETTWVRDEPEEGDELMVQIRYRSAAVPARIRSTRGSLEVWFEEPQEAVAPGQAGVLYRGDEVVGGGTIARALDGAVQ